MPNRLTSIDWFKAIVYSIGIRVLLNIQERPELWRRLVCYCGKHCRREYTSKTVQKITSRTKTRYFFAHFYNSLLSITREFFLCIRKQNLCVLFSCGMISLNCQPFILGLCISLIYCTQVVKVEVPYYLFTSRKQRGTVLYIVGSFCSLCLLWAVWNRLLRNVCRKPLDEEK